jgi:WD40 repeat protein
LSLDPEGRYLALATGGPQAVVIDMAILSSGAPKMEAVVFNRTVSQSIVPQVRVTSTGLVASAPHDGIYRVWDIASGELLFEIREEEMQGRGAAQFTWDGKQLAYQDSLGNIRFTPIDTYQVVEQAKAVLTRSLTDDECTQYLHTDGCED